MVLSVDDKDSAEKLKRRQSILDQRRRSILPAKDMTLQAQLNAVHPTGSPQWDQTLSKAELDRNYTDWMKIAADNV